VWIVDDDVGILTVEDVDGFDADAPELAAEGESFSRPIALYLTQKLFSIYG
jgi:hypothetical protein